MAMIPGASMTTKTKFRAGLALGAMLALPVAPALAEAPKGQDLGTPQCQRDAFSGVYVCRQGTERPRTYRSLPEAQDGYRQMLLLRDKRLEQNRFLFGEEAAAPPPPPQYSLPKQSPDALEPNRRPRR